MAIFGQKGTTPTDKIAYLQVAGGSVLISYLVTKENTVQESNSKSSVYVEHLD